MLIYGNIFSYIYPKGNDPVETPKRLPSFAIETPAFCLRKLSVSVNKHDEDAEVMPALPLPDIPAAPAPAAVKAGTWMSLLPFGLYCSNTNLIPEMVGKGEDFNFSQTRTISGWRRVVHLQRYMACMGILIIASK